MNCTRAQIRKMRMIMKSKASNSSFFSRITEIPCLTTKSPLLHFSLLHLLSLVQFTPIFFACTSLLASHTAAAYITKFQIKEARGNMGHKCCSSFSITTHPQSNNDGKVCSLTRLCLHISLVQIVFFCIRESPWLAGGSEVMFNYSTYIQSACIDILPFEVF